MIANCAPVRQRQPTIEVVDVGFSRADLTSRRELKFTVPAAHLDPLRQLLVGNGQRQIYNREVSVVHSLYFDQTGKQRICTSFGRRHEGLVVLEGKLPAGYEQDLRSFLHPFAARVERCSKYVHGCRMWGLIRE